MEKSKCPNSSHKLFHILGKTFMIIYVVSGKFALISAFLLLQSQSVILDIFTSSIYLNI